MTHFNIKLSFSELELLTTLAADQLFRREFIDPKMPGYKGRASDVDLGKALVGRLRAILDPRGARQKAQARIASGLACRP